jgi:hypothetical protein
VLFQTCFQVNQPKVNMYGAHLNSSSIRLYKLQWLPLFPDFGIWFSIKTDWAWANQLNGEARVEIPKHLRQEIMYGMYPPRQSEWTGNLSAMRSAHPLPKAGLLFARAARAHVQLEPKLKSTNSNGDTLPQTLDNINHIRNASSSHWHETRGCVFSSAFLASSIHPTKTFP